MDAIVTAGGLLLPKDPLYHLTQVDKKALIPLLGRPMISWVLDAICGSGMVEHIAVVGLSPQELAYPDKRVYFVDSVGSLIGNVFAGLGKLQELNPTVKKILILSSDIPLITPEIIRDFVEACGPQDGDIYYAVVEEKTMEGRFPDSKRTFVPFKGGRYSGGDVFLVDVVVATGNIALAQALTGSRKNYLKQAQLIGFDFIVRFLLRRMTVHDAAKRAGKKAKLDVRVVDTRFAELGMDLDKARHYEIIKGYLESGEAQTIHR